MDEFLRDTLAAFEPAADERSLIAALEAALERCGVDRYAYLALRPADDGAGEPVVLTNYRAEWQQRYAERGYVAVDPVLRAAQRTVLPVNWSDTAAHLGRRRPERRVLAEAAAFGMRHGITVPIHGPGGAFATLTVATATSAREFDGVWRFHRHALLCLALQFHTLVERHAASRMAEGPPPSPRLTSREREALLWAARGKTAWETSEILGIGEETVATHLKNAARKLEVYNKIQAVVKAIVHGLIAP